MSLRFAVPGLPKPAGSKRAFVYRDRRDGKMRAAVTDDNPESRSWKTTVTEYARHAMSKERWAVLFEEPLVVYIDFWLPRPRGHYGSGRNAGLLRAGAPPRPAVKPDLLKLARAIEDALTGVVYRDDALIVEEHLSKRYTTGAASTVIVVTRAITEERTDGKEGEEDGEAQRRQASEAGL